jgi:hypothetical protein
MTILRSSSDISIGKNSAVPFAVICHRHQTGCANTKIPVGTTIGKRPEPSSDARLSCLSSEHKMENKRLLNGSGVAQFKVVEDHILMAVKFGQKRQRPHVGARPDGRQTIRGMLNTCP